MNDTSRTVVTCENLVRVYQEESVPVRALNGVDFVVRQGEFASLSGPSGSGKSTLLNVIGGLDRPDEGDVSIDGVSLIGLSESDLAELRLRKIGFVFQAYNLIPVLTRARERRVHSAAAGCRSRGAARACSGGTRFPGPRRHERASPGRAFRWPTATRGHRPGHSDQPGTVAGRRADGQPGLGDHQGSHGALWRSSTPRTA